MKLSEAILKGCEMTPKQAFQTYGRPGWATCALGAAFEAIGVPLVQPIPPNLFPEVPSVTLKKVTRLNDYEGWSRERIASWLAEKGL